MNAHEIDQESESRDSEAKVVMFRPRQQPPLRPQPEPASFEMKRFPVDIRGNVTFGRLMSGLATVGLTVRVDARSGCVVITDDPCE
ncbi:MAG TPA: hypothetical protein VGO53_03225 [Steroidobacteraceae bacterium]|jgi:hypothetical protein|nr:hypothetical protein [Steroidobacteraceae bacterium]